MRTEYDYIIAGSGCAGLSLLMRLLLEPDLNQKAILVIDQSPKIKNDRTWCFWEKENGLFESIVHCRWQNLNFYSDSFSTQMDLAPYAYKMIRGIDFYEYVINYASQFSNVEFKYEKIVSISTENKNAIANTTKAVYKADFIFNSLLLGKIIVEDKIPILLQHFKGWFIKTEEDCFKADTATFMDFTVSQTHGTTFMYVLPTASNRALIEYTLFTEELLLQEQYDEALETYIDTKLNIEKYTVEQEEFGIIPMTSKKIPLHNGRVINMGIAGGQAKGSSGYAFKFIQKRTEKIVRSLVKYHHPFIPHSFSQKKFHFYDSVLLNVLYYKKINGDEIFSSIFKNNPVNRVFRFLDNESNFLEDLQIMRSVPNKTFFSATIQELIH